MLGLGASGPQVIEGFHGIPYDKPVARTREIIEICRMVWRRERVVHDGLYPIPLPEGKGTGLGKPLKLINHPKRADIPVWVAALGDKNVEMTAELADGWLPHVVLPEKMREVFGPALDAGAAKRAPELGPCRSPAAGSSRSTRRCSSARAASPARTYALYIGGMGARGRNFYNTVFARQGYPAEAELSRTSTSTDARRRPRPRCRTSSSTRSRSSVPRRRCRSASPPSGRPASPISTSPR